MLFREQDIRILEDALQALRAGFTGLPEPRDIIGDVSDVLQEAALRLRDNYPFFHPLYAGQMLKPPHPVAWLAYALAMTINPNNHALDGGRASSEMEKEAVAEIAAMFGWSTHLGHLCGGGTIANLEALWVAREFAPAKSIAASAQAHYTHSRLAGLLGVTFQAVPCDSEGRMDVVVLEERLRSGKIGTVVATLGSTATGAVDPLPRLLELRRQYGFRLHADAAYGGYFVLADNLMPETRAALDLLGEVDSLVIDPHKHGLQPYGCGCVLFRDPSVAQIYKHDSPYTYFSSSELHLGEISLECSRPGASAVALWATQRLLPLVRGGEYSRLLSLSRAAALVLHARIAGDARFIASRPPELDIVVWAPRAESVSEASRRSRAVFETAARAHLHLALADLPVELFDLEAIEVDQRTMLCLRSVLMKPEHHAWIDEIWRLLTDACNDVTAMSRE